MSNVDAGGISLDDNALICPSVDLYHVRKHSAKGYNIFLNLNRGKMEITIAHRRNFFKKIIKQQSF